MHCQPQINAPEPYAYIHKPCQDMPRDRQASQKKRKGKQREVVMIVGSRKVWGPRGRVGDARKGEEGKEGMKNKRQVRAKYEMPNPSAGEM